MQPFRKQRLQRRPICRLVVPNQKTDTETREREKYYPQTRITPHFISTLSQYIND
jgi:hypothetical protein